MRLRTLSVLLVLAVAIPIALVEYSYHVRKSTPTLTPSVANSGAGPVREPPQSVNPARPPAVPGHSEPRQGTDDAQSTAVKIPSAPEATLEFHGTLRSGARREIAGDELDLHLGDSVRPVWTNSLGEFAFSVPPRDLPVRLTSREGQTLYRLERAPSSNRVFVNPTLVAPTSGGDVEAELVVARSVTFERGVGADDCRVRAYGSTSLPASTTLVVRLLAGGDRIVQETLFDYQGDDLIGEIQFPFGHLYSGWYKLQIAWRVYSAPSEVLDPLRSRLPNPLPGELPEKLYLAVYVGDPDSERVQEDQVRGFYELAVRECKASRDLVQWVATSARGKPRNFKASRMESIRKHPLFETARALASPPLDLDKWREFVDRELPKLWSPYRDVNAVPFPEKYPARKQYLAHAYGELSKLTHLESRLVYRALGQPPDPRDYVDFDFAVETEHALTEERLLDFLEAVADDMSAQ